MVSHGAETYNIITGNVIKNEKVPVLKESLERVNALIRIAKHKDPTILARPHHELRLHITGILVFIND